MRLNVVQRLTNATTAARNDKHVFLQYAFILKKSSITLEHTKGCRVDHGQR